MGQPERLLYGPPTEKQYRASQWLIDQAATVRSAEEAVRGAKQEESEARQKLARYIAIHTTPEIWSLLSGDQADEVIDCQPDGEGYFGLGAEEGSLLYEQWIANTGAESPHIK
jgi:hypothetical protein